MKITINITERKEIELPFEFPFYGKTYLGRAILFTDEKLIEIGESIIIMWNKKDSSYSAGLDDIYNKKTTPATKEWYLTMKTEFFNNLSKIEI